MSQPFTQTETTTKPADRKLEPLTENLNTTSSSGGSNSGLVGAGCGGSTSHGVSPSLSWAGLLTTAQATQVAALAAQVGGRLRFAHGDVTARKTRAQQAPDGMVLIDWEWARPLPRGVRRRLFLWFSLVDVPGGRAHVEAAVGGGDARRLLLCALNALTSSGISSGMCLYHFAAGHLATKDELVNRLLQLISKAVRRRCR